MNTESMKNIWQYIAGSQAVNEWGIYAVIIALLLLYRKLRLGRWRTILKNSVEYHKFHLSNIAKDPSMNEKNRELAQALHWGATKQLAIDLNGGRGGAALWRSFLGDKTALNTCGTVYYQCARNYRYIDQVIIKLNDTLISTFYRIYFLESHLSLVAVLYMDITLLFYRATRPDGGAGRLYLEMSRETKKF